jgi:hypothetical protein
MFKTEEIHDVFTKQIGVKINNETARQQTPAFEATDQERANALGNVLLEIIFRGAENDPDHGDRPQPQLPEPVDRDHDWPISVATDTSTENGKNNARNHQLQKPSTPPPLDNTNTAATRMKTSYLGGKYVPGRHRCASLTACAA